MKKPDSLLKFHFRRKILGKNFKWNANSKFMFLMAKLITGFLFIFCITGTYAFTRLSDNDKYLGVIRLDMAYKKKIPALKLSNVADTVKYTFFNDNNSHLYMHPSIEFVNDECIIINDNKRYLYKYDKEGNFQWMIDKHGKGPGEYVQITDVSVDTGNQLIYVLDESQLKIITYKLLTGKYIREIRIPLPSDSFSLLGNSFVLWNPPWGFVDRDYCYFLTFMDRKGNVLKHIDRLGNNNDFHGGLLHSTWFYALDGHIYIKDTYNDTVYRLTRTMNRVPHAVVSSGKYTIPRKVAEDVMIYQTHLNDYISQLFFLETKHYMFLKFFKGVYYLVIYDKYDKRFISKAEGEMNRYATMENDLDGGPAFDPMYVSGEKMYALIPSEEFLKYPATAKVISKNNARMNEESNPVLMEVTLK